MRQYHLKQLQKQISVEQMKILMREFNLRSISSVYRAFELTPKTHQIKNIELINRAIELVQDRASEMNQLSSEVRELLVLVDDTNQKSEQP